VRGGSPVLASGRLFVSVIDPGDGTAGGLVAFDALTGEQLWEVRDGYSTHNAAAVADDVVVFAGSDAIVRAHDAATGRALWSYALGAELPWGSTQLYASPTIADGVVYIGIVRRFAALDLHTGLPLCEVEPGTNLLDGTFASAAVDQGSVVASFGRGQSGVQARDIVDGSTRWTIGQPRSLTVSPSPVLGDGVAFLANTQTEVLAVELDTGIERWHKKLYDDGHPWGYELMATPAYAHGTLYVPTMRGELLALDALSGEVLWRLDSAPSVLHPVHYRAEAAAYAASPIVMGEVVWAAGADGVLRAADAHTGELLWATELDAPALSAPVASGCYMYVVTWDGSVHAFHSASELSHCGELAPPSLVAGARPTDALGAPSRPIDTGCACRAASGSTMGSALTLLGLCLVGRRRSAGRIWRHGGATRPVAA
jgi:outer membrane protein assembly factor BamB